MWAVEVEGAESGGETGDRIIIGAGEGAEVEPGTGMGERGTCLD